MNTEQTSTPVDAVVSELSNGQIFKEKMGYSKTMARNMRKSGVNSPEEYRVLRNKRKKTEILAHKQLKKVKKAKR